MFDVVVVVDWSASNTPKEGRDSIWMAVRHNGNVDLHNPSTRRAARELLERTIERHPDQRLLVGIDVSLGIPAGTAQAAFGTCEGATEPWRQWWQHLAHHVVDHPDNSNNRFTVAAAVNARISPGPGPFWGTTTTAAVGPHLLRGKAPGFPHRADHGLFLDEFRTVEHVLRSRRHRPMSVWQLAGAGAVGSQSLTCIPVVEALRAVPAIGPRLRVWPFETGFVERPGDDAHDSVVVAEVWPTLAPLPDPPPHPVRDATQVVTLSGVLAAADADGRLGRWFDPGIPVTEQTVLLSEEGWVLGVGWPHPQPESVDGADAGGTSPAGHVTWMM